MFSLCVFAVTALFGGVTCDWICTLRKTANIQPRIFLLDPDSACENFKEKFENVREDLKSCTNQEININGLESLFKEFCKPKSDFRRSIIKNEECLILHSNSAVICMEGMREAVKRMPSQGYTINEICSRIPEYVGDCMKKAIGKPCGEGGLKAYQRIAEGYESFLKGLCLEIFEEKFGKSEVVYSGAPANYALLWSVLLGTLLAVKWYR